jgi:hypothetical protein
LIVHFIKDGKVLCGATHVHGKWTTIESHVTCDDCFAVIDVEVEERVHLEDHTFGNAPVEVSLARILNEINNRRLASRVGSLMNRFDSIVKEVNKMEKLRVKRYLLDISKKDFFSLVDDLDTNEKVKTHVKNALTIRYRKVYNREIRSRA